MNFFDLHCDTAYECATQLNGRSLEEGAHHISLRRGEKLGRWRQVFAIFMPDVSEDSTACRGELAVAHYNRVLAYLYRQTQLQPERFSIIKDEVAFDRVSEDGRCEAIISVEGGSAANGSLENIRRMYSDGVRMMTLTWNADNELASGVRGSGGGLTEFGRSALALMNELDMVADVSHLSDAGFFDVAQFSQKAFVATHSCSRRLCAHPRNLTDEMFEIIRDKGGIVGINFSRGFLEINEKATIDDILRHTEHFLSLDGENCVCMGSDFDGTDMPDGVSGVESMPAVYERFLRANYSETLCEKIFFGTANGFFNKVFSHSF